MQKNLSKTTESLQTARAYCESIDGVLIKVNDILEVSDYVHALALSQTFGSYFRSSDDSSTSTNPIYFWINRTNESRKSDHSISRCYHKSKSIDENCVVLQREKLMVDDMLSIRWCLTESDQCSSESARPICTNKPFETLNSLDVSNRIHKLNIPADYSCENDKDYHLIDGLCYKILFHETTWNKAKVECERENAILFTPDKMTQLSLIKSLFSRHHSHTSSDIIHVGILHDDQLGTSILLNTTSIMIDFNQMCKSRSNSLFEEFIASTSLRHYSINQTKNQRTRCGYVDFESSSGLSISCSSKSCERLATVICQKQPIVTMRTIYAEMLVEQTFNNQSTSKKKFNVILTIFLILIAFIMVGVVYAIRGRYLKRMNNTNTSQTGNEYFYSQLLARNELAD